MKNEQTKVAAYARVSTDKDDQANSLESQREYFESYIKHNAEWQFVGVYYDDGISGTQTKKREGFNRLIEDSFNGKIDLILTKEVSRFARNTVDTLEYTRKLKSHGVNVIFTIDNINTGEESGEFRLTIMASIAQEESRKTSERVKWGQRRQMEKGIVFGTRMLGYSFANKTFEIIEEEAVIVRTIFEKYANEGKGTVVIARELIESGMYPIHAKIWYSSCILRILKNEKYVGDLCQAKTCTPDYLTHLSKPNEKEKMIYIYDHHEPIIDRELWNKTQRELQFRSPADELKTKYSGRHWCSGIIKCGVCNNHYVSRTKKRIDGSILHAWRCYAAANHSKLKYDAKGNYISCKNIYVNELVLLHCMAYSITLLRENREQLKKELMVDAARLQIVRDYSEQITNIEKQTANTELKKRKAADALLDGLLSKEDYVKQIEWYNEELEQQHNALEKIQNKEQENKRIMARLEQQIKAIDDTMKYDAYDEKIYKEIAEKIVVYRNNVLDIWLYNIPFIIQLKFKTSGQRENYKIDILKKDLIPKP